MFIIKSPYCDDNVFYCENERHANFVAKALNDIADKLYANSYMLNRMSPTDPGYQLEKNRTDEVFKKYDKILNSINITGRDHFRVVEARKFETSEEFEDYMKNLVVKDIIE